MDGQRSILYYEDCSAYRASTVARLTWPVNEVMLVNAPFVQAFYFCSSFDASLVSMSEIEKIVIVEVLVVVMHSTSGIFHRISTHNTSRCTDGVGKGSMR